jgi:hypothetical protein
VGRQIRSVDADLADHEACVHSLCPHHGLELCRPGTAFAEQGVPRAEYNLAVVYDEGRVVPQDFAEAIYWCCRGANQDDFRLSLGRPLPRQAGQWNVSIWRRESA